MGIASVVPMVWGVATGHVEIAKWITLTAECICWVELRGAPGLRLRVLTGGTLLAIVFAFLGSVTADWLWAGVLGMLLVGFLSGLFKNLGDRGSGLAVSVFVLFIIGNANPPRDLDDLQWRCLYVLIGGLWTTLVGLVASAFIREQEPYRRSIAVIWKSVSALTGIVARGWDGKKVRSSLKDIYRGEQTVRKAIDSSLHFYEPMAHQVSSGDRAEYHLAQTRKATALAAAHITAISGELEQLHFQSLEAPLRLKLHGLLRALQQATDRMAVFVLTLKPEELLLVQSRIRRVRKLAGLLGAYSIPESDSQRIIIDRVLHFTERMLRLMESAIRSMEDIGAELPVYRSYSLLKTIYILHPRHLWDNIRLLFNFNTFMVRYAIRTAVGAALALFFYKWFEIDHGYWLAFTVIIVTQPYFGATIRKAADRIIGTVLGGFAGGMILRLPAGLHLQEIMLFVCSILMVYYIRKRYPVAVFFMTVSLVLVFSIDQAFDPDLLWIRALSTLAGAAIAVVAGFALLPAWDSKWLPTHLAAAIGCNYEYFRATFFPEPGQQPWTRHKRNAETRNSNLFDSFIRYMQEPSATRKRFVLYYHIITHNVRLTRELNNLNIEEDQTEQPVAATAPEAQLERIRHCMHLFNKVMALIQKTVSAEKPSPLLPAEAQPSFHILTPHQSLYLERMIIELNAIYQDLEKLSTSAPAGMRIFAP
jgi:uncharacterized membrane protein YccC